MTWHCSSISEDLHRFAAFAHKTVFVIVSALNLSRANTADFLQMCVNLQKYWNKVMSNDGLILEYMDLSHIHLAVFLSWFLQSG